MLFRSSLLLAFVASVTSSALREGKGSIPVDSKAGAKLMKEARALNNNNEEENTWMAKFDLKFDSCYSMPQVGRVEGGQENEANLGMEHIVKLKLCPSDYCTDGQNKCSGSAEYLVQMAEYVQSYVEMKEELREQACEDVRENCYCNDNQDDEACEAQCFTDKEMEYCIEDENEEEFNLEEYLECGEMPNQNNNNNNNNNNQYFIGPLCSKNGKSIHLGVFNDEGCINQVDDSIYSSANYGADLPYTDESIVQPDCISCKEIDENEDDNNNNNNNNYYEEPKVAEICEQMYEEAAKCEENTGSIGPYYKSNEACTYIHKTLPKLAKVYRGGGTTSAATAFAWIFGISTLALAGIIFYMYKNPAKIALASQGGIMS
jgi:hypothetical protein